MDPTNSSSSVPDPTTPPQRFVQLSDDKISPKRRQLDQILRDFLKVRKPLQRILDDLLDPEQEEDRSFWLQVILDWINNKKLVETIRQQRKDLPPVFTEQLLGSELSNLANSQRNTADKIIAALEHTKTFSLPLRGDPQRVECLKRILTHLYDHSKPRERQLEISYGVESAFSTPFHGFAPTLLASHILSFNDELFDHSHSQSNLSSTMYCKVLPILQSSGFGKTKLGIQLSARFPGMLVCLRPQRDNKDFVSFPPQDRETYDFLCSPLSADDIENHARIASWLSAYVEKLTLHLSNLKSISGCFDRSGFCLHKDVDLCWTTIVFAFASRLYEDGSFLHGFKLVKPDLCPESRLHALLLTDPVQTSNPYSLINTVASDSHNVEPDTCLNEYLDTEFRKGLLSDIVGQAKIHRQNMLDSFGERQEQAANSLANIQPPLASKVPSFVESDAKHLFSEKICEQFLKPSLVDLHNVFPANLKEGSFHFIALDECGSIAPMLPALRRIWNYAAPKRGWILLIDTNSELSPLNGRVATRASNRLSTDNTHVLVDPFVTMPVDVNLTRTDVKKIHSLFRSGQLTMAVLNQHLLKLGRPLWYDHYYREKQYIQPSIIMKKLIYPKDWKWPSQIPESRGNLNADVENILAVISQRIPLKFEALAGLTWFQNFINRQVAQHLRYIGAIYSDAEAIRTCTPSEPALSASAAWFIRYVATEDDKDSISKPEAKWSLAVEVMAGARAQLGLDRGLEGEEAVHLLCTAALDIAAANPSTPIRKATEFGGTPSPEQLDCIVSVFDWLNQLIGLDFWSRSGEQKADLVRWCRTHWINMTHIVTLSFQVSEAKGIEDDLALELWFRRAGAIGVSNQCQWDLVIMCLESDHRPTPEDQILACNLLPITLQIKNRAVRTALGRQRISASRKVSRSTPLSSSDKGLGQRQRLDRQCLEILMDLRHHAEPRIEYLEQNIDDADELCTLRHCIRVAGFDKQTYPVVAKFAPTAISKLPGLLGLPPTPRPNPWRSRPHANEDRDEMSKIADVSAGRLAKKLEFSSLDQDDFARRKLEEDA